MKDNVMQEKRKKQIEFLKTVLNKDEIDNRIKGFNFSRMSVYGEKVEIENLVIGYIKPKDKWVCLDFDNTNVLAVTVDVTIEQDLNGEELRLSVNNGTFRIYDISSINELEYTEDMLDCFDKESLYDLLERYDCSPKELAQKYLDDYGIEEVIGDFKKQKVNDEYYDEPIEYGIRWSSLQGLDSIMKSFEEQQVILFDDTFKTIKELESYTGKDLTDDDLYKIGVLINVLVKDNLDNVPVLDYILRECGEID